MRLAYQEGEDGLILTATETGKDPGRRIIHTHVRVGPEVLQALNVGDKAFLRSSPEARQAIADLTDKELADVYLNFGRDRTDPVRRGMRDMVASLLKE